MYIYIYTYMYTHILPNPYPVVLQVTTSSRRISQGHTQLATRQHPDCTHIYIYIYISISKSKSKSKSIYTCIWLCLYIVFIFALHSQQVTTCGCWTSEGPTQLAPRQHPDCPRRGCCRCVLCEQTWARTIGGGGSVGAGYYIYINEYIYIYKYIYIYISIYKIYLSLHGCCRVFSQQAWAREVSGGGGASAGVKKYIKKKPYIVIYICIILIAVSLVSRLEHERSASAALAQVFVY